MDEILSYYSTPIVGIIAVIGVKPKDFHFLQELKELLQFELQRHNHVYKGKSQEENPNIKVMNWVVKFNFKKIA